MPTQAQLEAIRRADTGYLFKWSFRIYDDREATALYNDTTLVVVPTGELWQGVAMLVSPYRDECSGLSRIVFSENGTRRIDIAGHPLKGRVVCERRCYDVPAEELEKCPRGTEVISLDGTDSRTSRGWTAEVLRGALSKLPEDPEEWQYQLDFPRSWLSVNPRFKFEGKIRRGHTLETLPDADDFCVKADRLYLDYAEWHGKGVVALEHSAAPYWYWAPCSGRSLSLQGENGAMLVEIGFDEKQ